MQPHECANIDDTRTEIDRIDQHIVARIGERAGILDPDGQGKRRVRLEVECRGVVDRDLAGAAVDGECVVGVAGRDAVGERVAGVRVAGGHRADARAGAVGEPACEPLPARPDGGRDRQSGEQ